MTPNERVERPQPAAPRETENGGARLAGRRWWRSARTPGWADSWDLDLGVAARRSGIDGCRYASDDGLDARPPCSSEHDDSDSAIREILLIPEVRVGGEQHVEATGLRSREQFPVAQRRPALFESGHHLMRGQVPSDRHWSALIEQNAHLRRRQRAPGRMVENSLDLLQGDALKPFNKVGNRGAIFEILEQG